MAENTLEYWQAVAFCETARVADGPKGVQVDDAEVLEVAFAMAVAFADAVAVAGDDNTWDVLELCTALNTAESIHIVSLVQPGKALLKTWSMLYAETCAAESR